MTTFIPQVRSKNHSCNNLRKSAGGIGRFPKRVIVRLGSITSTEKAYPKATANGRPIIEINTVEAVENSRSKLRMKACFAEAEVSQAEWCESTDKDKLSAMKFPILAKRIFGFKGKGMVKLDNLEQLEEFVKNNSLDGYYFEEFKNFAREYRFHCTSEGCFMAWRKLRRTDSKERWFFNSSNCNWVGEDHELFDRPANWDNIVADCVKALEATGLDIGAFDVRIQSSKKNNPEYILVEVNSAPSLGEQGVEIYREILTNLINKKINE